MKNNKKHEGRKKMTIGCEESNFKFKPCADCSFEYQPNECRKYRENGTSKTVYKSAKWD